MIILYGAGEGFGLPEISPYVTKTEVQLRMELALTEAQTIVFRNAAHGGLSVVYRRPDGNIGWIDPERTRVRNGSGGEEPVPAH